jgi:hypothetical protein
MLECDKILLTWGTGTNTLGVVALLEKTMNTTDWELEPSFCRARYGFASRITTSSRLASL